MPELIDKKETIAKIFALSGFFVDRSDYEFDLISAIIHRCCEEIDKQPIIEAEPVRHGRWKKKNGEIYCTNCKKSKWSESFELMLRGFDFCPKCGARMDGGDDNGRY